MSVPNGEKLATKQDLADMYQGILPYLGGMPEIVANKFSKGDLYSTDEKMIGQWCDGKPLYQKVITISGTVSNGTSIAHNISNVDVIFISEFMLRDSDNRYYLMQQVCEGTGRVFVTSTKVNIDFKTTNWTTNAGAFIVLKYTKTTDSAISIGSDTDYSTEEKIVGTWIDGKPLYQKTIMEISAHFAWQNQYFAKQSFSESALGISNIDRIIGGLVASTSGSSTWEISGTMKNSSTDIGLFIHNAIDSGTVNITLRYTKTTD